MRREEQVTVQGPIKKQQPDGMSHRGVRSTPIQSTSFASFGSGIGDGREVGFWECRSIKATIHAPEVAFPSTLPSSSTRVPPHPPTRGRAERDALRSTQHSSLMVAPCPGDVGA